MKDIFLKRPFKIRNADEHDLSEVLSLFVNPIDGLKSPLDYENSIVKGRMGSGKTMLLRANYAYYLYNLVPCLLHNQPLILPIFIRLSDFQHHRDPETIYREIILKLAEELTSVYLKLQDSKEMARIHHGMKRISSDIYFDSKIKKSIEALLKLGADQYVEKLSKEFSASGKGKLKFFEASANLKKNEVIELKKSSHPGLKDLQNLYNLLLKDSSSKLIILIDEAGSLNKVFFKSEKTGEESLFEVLMNQLRTMDFVRTKVAVYPNSYSDILTETRYGDTILLEENISTESSYRKFRKRVLQIIYNYFNSENYGQSKTISANSVFDISNNGLGDCIEQLINGSSGNYRRLLNLLDQSMDNAYVRTCENGTNEKLLVKLVDSKKALIDNCQNQLNLFNTSEEEFLNSLGQACKARGTFKFKFPLNSQLLYKYISKSKEYNIINILEQGQGRKGTIYTFDYSYCVTKDIPTHYIKNTEKIDRDRSILTGSWIARTTTIDNEKLNDSASPNKIEGFVVFGHTRGGFIDGRDGVEYFFTKDHIVELDQTKPIHIGKKVLFYPWKLGDTDVATDIEFI